MNRDDLLLQEDKNFLKKIIDKIFRRKPKDFKKELIKAIDTASKQLKSSGKEKEVLDIFSKRVGVKLTSLSQLKKNLNIIESEDDLNEGAFGEWWDAAKDNAFNAMAFYPMLTMFLELDKVIKGTGDASLRVTLTYLLIWVMIIAGKITNKHIISKSKEKKWKNLSGNPYAV